MIVPLQPNGDSCCCLDHLGPVVYSTLSTCFEWCHFVQKWRINCHFLYHFMAILVGKLWYAVVPHMAFKDRSTLGKVELLESMAEWQVVGVSMVDVDLLDKFTYSSIFLVYLFAYLTACLHVHLSMFLSVCLTVCHLSIYQSVCLSIYLSINLSIHPSILVKRLSIYLSTYLSTYLAI